MAISNPLDTGASMHGHFRLAAVGDISFEGPAADRPSTEAFAQVAGIFQDASLAAANLECALTTGGTAIPGKCTLRGSPGWAPVMRQAGIGLVSLANNHIMDYGPEGLASTLDALRRAGISAVGAGPTRREACAPLVLDVAGTRVAFLARTSVVVSAPTYAGERQPGVAWLDPEETTTAIASCRQRADIVVLLAHWGLEEYAYPAPSQRSLARQFIDAGADVVLGHHPHVLQGFERYQSGLIAHSLGNFVFHEFEWSYASPGQPALRQLATLSADNRKGIVATVECRPGVRPELSLVCTTVDRAGQVRVDTQASRQIEIDHLSAALDRLWYRRWWQWYAARREWNLRMRGRLSIRLAVTRLHRLRPRHFLNLAVLLRRSGRMVSETTTNPYE